MYVLKMSSLYQIEGVNSYFRQLGLYCFDFVGDIQFATKFESLEDCNKILEHSDWYCKMYNASKLEAIKI